MAWTDVANQLLGPQAQSVIGYLQAVDPNFDWSQTIRDYVPRFGDASNGWQDPARGSSVSIAQQLIQFAGASPNTPPEKQALFQSSWPQLEPLRQHQAAQQLAAQQHDDGGIGGLLGIAGGIAGNLIAPGIGGAIGAGLGSLAGGASPGNALLGAGLGYVGGKLFSGLGTAAPAATGGGMDGAFSNASNFLSPLTNAAMSSGYTFDPSTVDDLFGSSASSMFGTGGAAGMTDISNMFPAVDTGLGNFQLGTMNPDYYPSYSGAPGAGFGLDASGAQTLFGPEVTNPSAGALGQFVDPATGQINWNMPGAIDALNGLMGNGGLDSSSIQDILKGAKTLGSNAMTGIGNWLSNPNTPGNLLKTAGSTVPGLMALNYANSQPGINTGPLQGILGQMGANTAGYTQAALDPFQQNIAAGYGDLLQSQAKRGIRGSSFGDTDIANYIATTGRSLANAGANAFQGSLANQGNLAAQIAALMNQGQTTKNQLFGRAFDVLGRGLNPASYMGNINLGGMGATGG